MPGGGLAAMNWAFQQPLDGPGIKLILITLADHADENATCFPGVDTLAERTAQSERTVLRHLQELQRLGLVEVERRHRENGSRTSNRYWLRLDVTVEAQSEPGDGDVQGDTVTPGQGDTVTPPPNPPGYSPPDGGEGASAPGKPRKPFTERCAEWIAGQGIALPSTTRQLDRCVWILRCMLDSESDPKARRSTTMGIIRDYVEDLTGEKPGRDASKMLAQLIGEFDGERVLRATGEAMVWGAGLGEEHRDDPLALAKYVSAVLHGERQGAA